MLLLSDLIKAGWFDAADKLAVAVKLSGVDGQSPAKEGIAGMNRILAELNEAELKATFAQVPEGIEFKLPKAYSFDGIERESLLLRTPKTQDLIECGIRGGLAEARLACHLCGVVMDDFAQLPAATALSILEALSPFLE